MEWLNADTEWRDESRAAAGARARALSVSPGRNAGVTARSSRRDARAMGRAHATAPGGRARRGGCPRARRAGWTTMRTDIGGDGFCGFRRTRRRFARSRCALRSTVRSTDDAAADAAQSSRRLKRGAVYSAIDAIASPAAFEFSASGAGHRIDQGDVFNDTAATLTFTARTNAARRRSDRPSKGRTHL